MVWALLHAHGEDEEDAEIWMMTLGVNGRSGYECCALGRDHCFGRFTGETHVNDLGEEVKTSAPGLGFKTRSWATTALPGQHSGSRIFFMDWLGYDDLELMELTEEGVLGRFKTEVPKQGWP